MNRRALDTIAFGEKLLALLDEGAFTSTYKFAVLLGLIDLCTERSGRDGKPPREIPSRSLALKVIELYWPHSAPFRHGNILKQNSSNQAKIISLITDFQQEIEDGSSSHFQARLQAPELFEALVFEVEWKLIEMPLPRLQRFGTEEDRFIYDLSWTAEPRRGAFSAGELDTTIALRPGAGEKLVSLSGLLRPLVQRQWAERVVRFNRNSVREFELEDFLFGTSRTPPRRLVTDLRDLQNNECFYCRSRLATAVDVDHFIPWARHPNDNIQNLVIAHRKCNSEKRDFLSATDHVQHWCEHRDQVGSQLEAVAQRHRWMSDLGRTQSVARAIYLRLRDDFRLWRVGSTFEKPDQLRLRRLFASPYNAEDGQGVQKVAEPSPD